MSDFSASGEAMSSTEGSSPILQSNYHNDTDWGDHLDDKTWDTLDNDWLSESDYDLEPYMRLHSQVEGSDEEDQWGAGFNNQPGDELGLVESYVYNYDDADDIAPALENMHPDTAEVTEYIIDELNKAVFTQEVDGSLDGAQEKYGDEFDQAFHTVIESGDADIAQRILSEENPGEALMRVFRQARLLNEIPDGDLNGWARQNFEALIQEALLREYAERELHKTIHHSKDFPPPSIIRAPGSSGPYRESIPSSVVSYAFGD